MKKMPWIKFEPLGWAGEESLLGCSIAAEGAWIRTCSVCYWPNQNYSATKTMMGWAMLWRLPNPESAEAIINEFDANDVCRVTRSTAGITLTSRKLERENDERLAAAERQREFRERKSDSGGNSKVPSSSISSSTIITDIYNLYPRKVGRKAALAKIVKAIQDGASPERLMAAVKKYADAVSRWPSRDLKYVPHPSTWFHQARYDDDPAEWERKGDGLNPEWDKGKP